MLALALLLIVWVGMRVLLWDRPLDEAGAAPGPAGGAHEGGQPALRLRAAPRPDHPGRAPLPLARLPAALSIRSLPAVHPPIPVAAPPLEAHTAPPLAEGMRPSAADPAADPADGDQPGWQAIVADLHHLGAVRQAQASAPAALVASSAALPRPAAAKSKWSADSWLLWRRGSQLGAGGGAAGLAPSYGASQLGAVLRFRLSDGGARPAAYLRASAALRGGAVISGEHDLALGLSVRPIARLPLTAAIELRASHFAGGTTHLRPAAMLITALPPKPLPLGARAELYAATGYVGGAGATAFVDGQLHIDAPVAALGPAEMRAGAGAWGGAQQGAGRLDLGPAVTLQLAAGRAAARLSADWRFRVAGNAAPASGPALTLSAGF